jgi:hypothetical protein
VDQGLPIVEKAVVARTIVKPGRARHGAPLDHWQIEAPAVARVSIPGTGVVMESEMRLGPSTCGWQLEWVRIRHSPLSIWLTRGGIRFAENADRRAVGQCGGIGACSPARHCPDTEDRTRLQVDTLFARFYFDGDNNWKVQIPGGELLEFGDVYAGESATERDPSGHGLRWFLARDSDATHRLNYVRYRYQKKGARSLVYLTDIFDTPQPNGSATDISFAHHTQLTWTAPSFPQSAYAFPDHARRDLVLTRVGVASTTWLADGEREVLRTYYLDYADTRGIGYTPPSKTQVGLPYTAPLWGHAFLNAIRLYGDCHQRESQGVILDSQQCNPFPPTNFEYEGGTIGFLGGQIYPWKFQGAPPAVASGGRYIQNALSAVILDFNRDGLPDVVQGWESGPVCLNRNKGHAINQSHTVINGFDVIYCCPDDGSDCDEEHGDRLWSAEPLMGYTNQGRATETDLVGTFQSQCMDTGPRSDSGRSDRSGARVTPLDFINDGDRLNFLTPQAGGSLMGEWSYGQVGYYSVTNGSVFAPMAANPLARAPDLPPSKIPDLLASPPMSSMSEKVRTAEIGLEGLRFLLGPAVNQPVIRLPTPRKVWVRPRHPEVERIVQKKI